MDNNIKKIVDNIYINSHSSIKISAYKNIYIDPFEIKEEKHDSDIIFITHSHHDHLSIDDINKIINKNTKFVIPKSIESSFNEKISLSNEKHEVLLVDINGYYDIDDIDFYVVPAYNVNKDFHKREFKYVGYIFDIKDVKIYVAGDTDENDENKNIKCDIALVPIGGTYTMTATEAADFVNNIKPKVVIPEHYGSIVGTKEDFDVFNDKVNKDIEVVKKLFI